MSFFHGKNILISIFGQSHSEFIGVTIEGLPSGIEIDDTKISKFLSRRAPNNQVFSTSRSEKDTPIFACGVLNGKTTGNALTVLIKNEDAKSADYKPFFDTPRPGHADFTAHIKYGENGDKRGGGAFSGRMTAPLCVAGAIAKNWLEKKGIFIGSHILSIYNIKDDSFNPTEITKEQLFQLQDKTFATISETKGDEMLNLIQNICDKNDSVGGQIEAAAINIPTGLGGELFDGLESKIARLIFSIPAVKGLEFGAGFDSTNLLGSENNDDFYILNEKDKKIVKTAQNNHGGLLGGITSGMPLIIKVAIKPTPSIAKKQKTVNLKTMQPAEIELSGRFDACIVPRTLPIVESTLAITLFDEMLNIY